MIAIAKWQSGRADGPAPAPATNTVFFAVKSYQIEGNTVLPPEKFDFLTNYTGPAFNKDRLFEGLGKLQLLYRNLGFATVSVTVPGQSLSNGIVHVKIIEGRLSQINVQSNRFFSSNNVLRALPSLRTNILLNSRWFQPELDQANANADRQIYPVLSPGVDPGTTDLTLNVKDRLPLHGHIEINNRGAPETPSLRIDTALQYNNLWQLNHQIGAEYNFSPQQMKPDGSTPALYDNPAFVSYSGFYRIPFGPGQGLRENYDQLPVDFGYDEVTHRFNLPPPTGGPELIFYASQSSTDTGSHAGPVTTVASSPTLDVFSQNLLRNPTETGDLGSKWILPLAERNGVQSSFSVGWDYKSYLTEAISTNLTTVIQYSTNPPMLLRSSTVTNNHSSGNRVYYMPISFGGSGSRADKWGSTSFYYNQNVFAAPLQSPRSQVQAVAGSAAAGGNYTTATGGLTREQKLPDDWSLLLNASGQWSSEPLVGNEQFALGGTSGVRGYREGETYGDTGWRTLMDLRLPPFSVGSFPTATESIPAHVRCSWFMDYGQVYHLGHDAAPTVRQWGTGAGAYWTIGQHVDGRLTLGWALDDANRTLEGELRAYFSIGVKF
jgi:hemolysin activation/secretion protein